MAWLKSGRTFHHHVNAFGRLHSGQKETGKLEWRDVDTHSNWKAESYGGATMAPLQKAGENETGKALTAVSPGTLETGKGQPIKVRGARNGLKP